LPETPIKTKTKTAKVKTVKVKTVKVKTRTMPAGQFKTHGLSVIDEVHNRREEVVITKYGKPMARLVPLNDKPDSTFGFMQGKRKLVGDIVSRIFPEDNWDSERLTFLTPTSHSG
jgi:antitoxin (DNA-binding transcriptional repressor) of toxin-antitoxin stability system